MSLHDCEDKPELSGLNWLVEPFVNVLLKMQTNLVSDTQIANKMTGMQKNSVTLHKIVKCSELVNQLWK